MIDVADLAQDPRALVIPGKSVNAGIDATGSLEDFSSEVTIFAVDPAPPLSSQPPIEEPPPVSRDLYRHWQLRAREWMAVTAAVATEAKARVLRRLIRGSERIRRRDFPGTATRVVATVRLAVRRFDPPRLRVSWVAVGKTRAAVIALVVLAAVYGFARFDRFVSTAPENAPETPRPADLTTPTVPELAAAPAETPRLVADRVPASPGGTRSTTSSEARPVAPQPAALRRDEKQAVLTVLGGYRDAFSTLDPRAVAAVWPSADLASLQKQFAAIDDQNLEFEQCQVSIVNVRATASCTGVVESGFRPGQRRLRSTRAQWQFTLEKAGSRWLIRTASGGRS
jgi:hypothetical protein